MLIGNQLDRGISGGQAKRTNIGIALITHPRVLFMDEPTTGLDSYTANEASTHSRAGPCMRHCKPCVISSQPSNNNEGAVKGVLEKKDIDF